MVIICFLAAVMDESDFEFKIDYVNLATDVKRPTDDATLFVGGFQNVFVNGHSITGSLLKDKTDPTTVDPIFKPIVDKPTEVTTEPDPQFVFYPVHLSPARYESFGTSPTSGQAIEVGGKGVGMIAFRTVASNGILAHFRSTKVCRNVLLCTLL